MSKIGFDNAEYIKKQSEQIAKRISEFGENSISNSEVNSSTIITPHEYCPASSPTVSFRCSKTSHKTLR